MDLPLGYSPKGVVSGKGEKLVCRLHKSLYGLKQASRQWFSKFSDVLLSLGFSQSKSDYSLFIRGSGSEFIALLVYVDDIIITGASLTRIEHLKTLLNDRFKLKDLGSLKYFLDLKLARSSHGIVVSQRYYTLQLLEDVGFLACKPALVPMDPLLKLKFSDEDLLTDPSEYRRLIGRLLYLTISRPDIAFAINKLSQFVSCPCKSHLAAVYQLLRYLKSNP